MKIKKRGIVIISVLFAVLCLAQTASAFYAPNHQRWVNRDPIEEAGGVNLYAFCANGPIDKYDSDGQKISILPRRDRSSCGFWDNRRSDPNKCTSGYATAASIVCRIAGESAWEQCQRACLQDTFTPFGEDCCSIASTARFVAKTAARYALCAAACAAKYGSPKRTPLPPPL
jgi:hypothetical protein